MPIYVYWSILLKWIVWDISLMIEVINRLMRALLNSEVPQESGNSWVTERQLPSQESASWNYKLLQVRTLKRICTDGWWPTRLYTNFLEPNTCCNCKHILMILSWNDCNSYWPVERPAEWWWFVMKRIKCKQLIFYLKIQELVHLPLLSRRVGSWFLVLYTGISD